MAGRWGLPCLCLLAALSAGCATTPQPGVDASDPAYYDPLEGFNRAAFDLNRQLDQLFIAPWSEFYVMVTPSPIRDNVTSFFDNLSYPNVVLNSLLQGKIEQAFDDLARFVLNSTLGILGIVDIASGFGFQRHDEDFGQTLAVWGFADGPYLDLPGIGPSTARDVLDVPLSIYTNPLHYINVLGWPFTVVKLVDNRARLGPAIQMRDEAAVDPYVFQREAYRQRRRFLIYDGNPPLEEFDLEPASGDR